MSWKISITIFLSLFYISIAHAEMRAHRYGGPVGLIEMGTAGKGAGDIISVSTDADVASSCNFDKQIVVTKTSILCVYRGEAAAS